MRLLKVFILILFTLCAVLLHQNSASAASCTGEKCLFPDQVCAGTTCSNICNSSSSTVCQQATNQKQINPVIDTINTAANIVAVVTGVIAVIMIIIGGIKFATAAGNSEQAAGARRQIMQAIIGIVIVALAWTITRFVVDKVIQ